ncbi:MAG: PAS domain S-box protein [Methanoregula sp.]|nr:PAS domain S-box protein [Methanoregula sp.]
MILQYSPWFIPFLVSAVMMTLLAVIGWNYRNNTIAWAFIFLTGCAAFWSMTVAIEMIAADFPTSYIMTILSYLAIVMVPVALLFVVFCYTGLEQYVTLRLTSIFMIVPVLVVIAIVSNPVHHLFYTGFIPVVSDGVVIWQYLHGPLFWVVSVYAYLILFASLLLIVYQILLSHAIYRQQLFILLAAAGIPLCVNLAYTFSIPPFPPYLPLTAISFSLTALILAPGILRYRFLSLIPVSCLHIFAAIRDSVIVVDTGNQITDLNPMAERVLPVSTATVIGEPVGRVFPFLMPLLEGITPEGDEIHREIALNRHDATQYFDVASIPLRVKNGPSMGRLILLHDITSWKKQDEAIREGERRFHELVDLLPEIVFECDFSSRFTYVNDNGLQLFGHSRDDLERGLDMLSHIIPEDRQRVMQDIGKIVGGEKSRGSEYTAMKQDGTRFPVIVFTTRVMRNNRCTGIRGILINMTQQKKTEYAMKQAMDKLTLLNSITRHDILNKLTALSAYLNLAREDVTDPNILEYLDRCTEGVTSVNEHVEFMRDYQEIGIHSPVWQDPAVTIHQSSGASGYPGIRITIPDPGWEIFTDPLFEKVIYNLIDNAIRHGGHVKTIAFSLGETPAGLILTCEDDGAGIPEEYKSNLFRKGFGKNTGLGLFLSREILGITAISIQETGVQGCGARFEICIPRGGYRRKNNT